MSLRSELQQILAEILPASPEDAVKGTELIQLVRLRLKSDCSDATLRYNFSMMSADPAAPIAKVDQGQGYYRRPRPDEETRPRQLAALWQARLDEGQGSPQQLDLELARWQRFRALVRRWLTETGPRRLFQFSQDATATPARTSLWHYPDLIHAEPGLGPIHAQLDPAPDDARTGPDAGPGDPHPARLALALGLPAWRLRGLTLRAQVHPDNCREAFYQALSAASWTHLPAFHIACAISDARLAGELRRLGRDHGVEIISYCLALSDLDNLPAPDALAGLSEREFEAAFSRVRLQVLSPGRPRPALSGEALADLARHTPEVPALLGWIAGL